MSKNTKGIVFDIIRDILGDYEMKIKIDENATLRDLGFDSLDQVDLMYRLQHEFDIVISEQEMEEFYDGSYTKTIREIIDRIEARQTKNNSVAQKPVSKPQTTQQKTGFYNSLLAKILNPFKKSNGR